MRAQPSGPSPHDDRGGSGRTGDRGVGAPTKLQLRLVSSAAARGSPLALPEPGVRVVEVKADDLALGRQPLELAEDVQPAQVAESHLGLDAPVLKLGPAAGAPVQDLGRRVATAALTEPAGFAAPARVADSYVLVPCHRQGGYDAAPIAWKRPLRAASAV